MADKILNVTIVGETELFGRLERITPSVLAGLLTVTRTIAIELEAYVKTEKLSGQVLNVVRGNLRRSIHNAVTQAAALIQGMVFSDGSVKYARIHEYGGTINHPGGTAYFVSYAGGVGGVTFVSNKSGLSEHLPRTKPHTITMPERSFLRSALADMRGAIATRLQQAAVDSAVEAFRR